MYEQKKRYRYILFSSHRKNTVKSFFGTALPWSNGLARCPYYYWGSIIDTYEQKKYSKQFSGNAESHMNMHQWPCAHTLKMSAPRSVISENVR